MRDLLVIGGGFAGLSAAVVAADENERHGGDLKITMVSRSEHLTMRPRLYERDPETLRVPLAPVLDPVGIRLVVRPAVRIDVPAREVELADGSRLPYAALILAAGSSLAPLALPGREHTFDIDSYEGAVALDRHLARVLDAPDAPGHATFVIVGGGMTGIELAAEMRTRIAHHAGESVASRARVVLLERADVIGPELGANPRPVIERALADAGVEVRLRTVVAGFDARGVSLADGSRIDAATVVVTIGLRASPLAAGIPGERDDLGRLVVDDFQRVPGAPGVYATGDVARAVVDADENVALMSCQHARTMGKYAGYNAAHDLLGLPPRAYRQPDYVTCLDLGRFGAVFTRGWNREVHTAGPDAKRRKIMINTERIYPPRGSKEAIFAGMRIDAGGR